MVYYSQNEESMSGLKKIIEKISTKRVLIPKEFGLIPIPGAPSFQGTFSKVTFFQREKESFAVSTLDGRAKQDYSPGDYEHRSINSLAHAQMLLREKGIVSPFILSCLYYNKRGETITRQANFDLQVVVERIAN